MSEGAGADSATWSSRSVEHTERAGAALAGVLQAGDVIAISGPLGAGKTRFVNGLARGLGHAGEVRSPTFTLVNEYHGREILYHVDLYRLDPEEVDALGLDELLEQGVLGVEWGERLPTWLLEEALAIEIRWDGEQRRSLAATARRGRGLELLGAWRSLLSGLDRAADVSGPGPSPAGAGGPAGRGGAA